MDHKELISTLTHCLSQYRDNVPSITGLYENFTLASNSLMVYLKDLNRKEKLQENEQSIVYIWSYEAKSLALLYRDILFNHYKDKFVHTIDSEELYSQQKALLSDATHSVIESLRSSISDNKTKNEWKHYQSPVPVIIEQIEALESHMDQCSEASQVLDDAQRDMTLFGIDVGSKLDNYIEQLEDAEQHALSLQKELIADPKKILSHLTKTEKHLKDSLFKADISDLYFSKSMEARVPVSIKSGLISYKDINFKDQINYWIDNEVLPDYNPFIATRTNALQKLYLGISNIKGKLQEEDVTEREIENSQSLIQSQITKISQKVSSLRDTKKELVQKINDSLKIEQVFSDSFHFLVSPSQLQIDYYGKSTKNIVANTKILQLTTDAFNRLKNKVKGFVAEDKLSNAFDFIDSALLFDDTVQSIFTKRGYVGDSFYEHRETIQNTLRQSIGQWRNGFLGSAIISGDYQSGKSSILGYLHHSLLDEIVILEPNKNINITGQKENFGCNLEGAIKYAFQKMRSEAPLVIMIDDIEKWDSEEWPVYANLKALMKAMESYGSKIYFLVSCNNWLKKAADRQLGLSRSFATQIDSSKMDVDDIVNATMKRHLASLHSVEDHDQDIDEEALIALVKKHTRHYDRNIGASLRQWFCSSEKKKSFVPKMPRSFVQIIQDHEIVFNYLLKYRKISEARISREFGSGTIRSVQESIPYLIQNKLLKREIGGELKINPNLLFYVEKAAKKLQKNTL